MFRRSRFNIQPNVGTPGRTAAAPQESPAASQEASENPKIVTESCTATAVTDKSAVTQSEKTTAVGDGNDQNGEGTSSSAAVQRRKRFSIKPKVAPGRPSILARMSKSPVKAVSETPVEVPVSELDKPATSSQTGTTAAPQRLQSPRRQRPSEESKQPKMQHKPTLIPSDGSEPSVVTTAEDSPKQACVGVHRTNPPDSGKELEGRSSSQVEEVPSRLPEKVPPSLPDKDAINISEKARTLVSSKSGLSPSLPAFSLSRLLNDPSDLQRLAKARKLRELLKQEMHKEKKIKKPNARAKECTLDPTKMTMRDLIRYLPLSNPMSTSLEDSAQENETVVPPSPVREVSPERAQEPEVPPKISSPRLEEEVEAEEEQDDSMMVPQVKVAEDGSLIIDEESLTVEVQRAKGPNSVQDRDPIFERGSTTTYSSFRKGTYSKPWSNEETDMFFLAISMVGTDFSMICQLFPHRARSEIKNKFKKEERENSWRIDKAFRERRKLDIEYFSKLLEKILEVQKNRKKLMSLAGKKSPKKQSRKAKGKKAAMKLNVVEEDDEEKQTEMPDLEEEEEGEKENEDFCNEGETTVAKPKLKREKKDASIEEPNDKKKKMGEKSNEQDEAYLSGVTEATLLEDRPTSDMSEKTDSANEAKDTTIKPAKLSRGRVPKPLLPLGRKWGKKVPPPSTKTNDTPSDKGDGNKDASPLRQANNRKSANDDSEEEDATVQPPIPTRYGRVPKPNKPLNYPAKESGSETTAASPAEFTDSAARPKPKCTAKRGRSSKQQLVQMSKKPKLVTLMASQSEYSDEEDEQQKEEETEVEEEQRIAYSSNKYNTTPVFVPASLQSPHPVISEVEETMEELDILANMPDVLGISQDVLCPDASCELAQNEAGTAEPCEHQLDLLVDVIDFLASDHTEVTEDESYNEAAQTLLTIGNLAHLSQSAQKQIIIQDHLTETASVSVNGPSQHLEEKNASQSAAQEKNTTPPLIFAASVYGVTETLEALETFTTVELQNSARDNDNIPVNESSDQRASSDMDPTPQLLSSAESSKTDSPQTRRGRLSKVKPKPNLGQASRTAQSKSHLETLTVRTAEERHTAAPDLSQATETAAEETSKMAHCNRTLLKDEISCVKVKHAEEPSGNQRRSVGQVKSDTATSDQSASGNQIHNFSEAQFEPSLEQATIHSRPTSGSADELLMSHLGSSDLKVSELQIEQGSNIDTVPVHESNYHSAPPLGELPVSQKEESEVGSTRQTRTGRFQKVNLAQTLRTAHSKPQTTKYTTEKHSNPTPNPKFYEKTVADVEAEPTCTTSPEKPSQSPASDLIALLDLGTTLTPTEELSTTKEKKKEARLVTQVESGAATLHQSASESQNISEAQFQPSMNEATIDTTPILESTDEKRVRTRSSSPTTSDSAITVSQVGQGSNIDSAPVQESRDHPAPCVKPGEELPVSRKEESEVSSTCPTRMNRFQRVRPKVNLTQTLRTARSKPQTTKETTEKDCNPTLNPKFHENTIAEVEAESICTTYPKKTSQSPGPASDFISSLDLGYTLTPTEELSTTVEKKTDVGESSTVTSEQGASETQNLSKAQFESSMKQATRDRTPTLESTDEKRVGAILRTTDSAVTEPQVGQGSPTDSAPVQENIDHLAPCVTPVDQLPVSQKEESKVKSTCQTMRGQLQNAKSNLSQMTRTVRSKPQSTKDPVTPMQLAERPSSLISRPESIYGALTEVEAKPTCSTTPSEKPSQIISTNTASMSAPLELCSAHKTTEELASTDEQKTDVGCGLASNSEGPEKNIPQRRRRFDKVKPNLGSFPRTTRTTKLQSNDSSKPSEQCHMDTSLSSEQQFVDNNNEQTQRELTDSKHLTHSSLHTELLTSTKLQDSTNDEGTSSDDVIIARSWVAENQSVLTESVLQNKRSEKPTVGGESTEDSPSNSDMVEAGPSSQWDCKQDMFIRTTETNSQPTDDPTAVSDPQKSVEDCSTESNIGSTLPTNTQSIPDPKEIIQQPQSENESEAQIQDVLHQFSEINQAAALRPDQSEPKFSPSRNTSQTCRGLLMELKPRLGHSRQPPQPQQVQNTEPVEDFGTHSEGLDTSVCHNPASEDQPDVQEPVERAVKPFNQISSPNGAGSSLGCLTQLIEQLEQHDPPPIVAGSFLNCVTQGSDSCTQDASISSTVATQILQSFTIYPDILMQQEPSDPDEPFFILSLTEIPVGPSGEVVGSVPEPLPYHPLTDASIAQQSIPGESSAAAGDGPLSDVAVPESIEESSVTGLISVNDIGPDPAAYEDWIMENPVDPHESTTVHPSKLPENVEKNDETEICPTKQGGTRRREAQDKPNNSKRKQASKTFSTKEAEPIPIPTDTTQQSELPEPSVQAKTAEGFVPEPQTGSGGCIDVEKETRTGGEDPEGSSSGTQTTQTMRTRSRNRKAKDFLSSISETNNTAPASDSLPSCKAASNGRKVRALRAAGKPSAPIPPTSYDDAPSCRVTQLTEKPHSASSTTSPTHIEVKQTSEQSTLYSVTTPSTFLCPAEVSASQHCVESSMEEEPTNVSQYFLSDIFTEVEEG